MQISGELNPPARDESRTEPPKPRLLSAPDVPDACSAASVSMLLPRLPPYEHKGHPWHPSGVSVVRVKAPVAVDANLAGRGERPPLARIITVDSATRAAHPFCVCEPGPRAPLEAGLHLRALAGVASCDVGN